MDSGLGPTLSDFAERFFAGVCAGAAVVSVVDIQSWWAASLAFSGFVMWLVCRWVRLVQVPSDTMDALDAEHSDHLHGLNGSPPEPPRP